jgi:hypothetical protein
MIISTQSNTLDHMKAEETNENAFAESSQEESQPNSAQTPMDRLADLKSSTEIINAITTETDLLMRGKTTAEELLDGESPTSGSITLTQYNITGNASQTASDVNAQTKQITGSNYSGFANNLDQILKESIGGEKAGKHVILGETHSKVEMLDALSSDQVMDTLKQNNVNTLALEIRGEPFQKYVDKLANNPKYTIDKFVKDATDEYKNMLTSKKGFSVDKADYFVKNNHIDDKYERMGKIIKSASKHGIKVLCAESHAGNLKEHFDLVIKNGRLEQQFIAAKNALNGKLEKNQQYSDLMDRRNIASEALYNTLTQSPNDTGKVESARNRYTQAVKDLQKVKEELIANDPDIRSASTAYNNAKAALSKSITARLDQDIHLSETISTATKKNGGNTVVVYGEFHGSRTPSADGDGKDLDEFLNAKQIRLTITEQDAKDLKRDIIMSNELLKALGQKQRRDPPDSYLPLHGDIVK